MRVIHLDSGIEWRGGQVQLWHLLRHTSGMLAASPRSPLFARALREGIEVLPHEFRDPLSAFKLGGLIRRTQPDLVAAHTSREIGRAHV